MSVKQKITYTKEDGDFSSAEDDLDDLLSVLSYYVSDSSMANIVRSLENSSTLIETRTWTNEGYANYRSARRAGGQWRNHINDCATTLSSGNWSMKIEINDVVTFVDGAVVEKAFPFL